MENKLNLDREAWLTEAGTFILDDIIKPQMQHDWEPPTPVRFSVGFPPRSTARSKTIAVCIASRASADGHSEIFVSPKMSDSLEILAALVHECIHASDDCKSGHQHHFARLARAVGLEGKLTATRSGDMLNRKLKQIVEILGEIPHAAIDIDKAQKKQTTRMLKVACPDKQCGFTFRTSQKNVNKITEWLCPACNIHDMKEV